MKKLDQKVEEFKGKSSGVVIVEKGPRENSTSSPSKNGKAANSFKGKEVAPVPEAKKVVKPSIAASSRVTPASKPGEGTSASRLGA